ncbi:MAG: 30S ribosomal protein S11 [Candidatus Yanofskybacteria bacterium RIFCSPHIGHO2_02_FULL_50_12]|uniref:Small ribosomal subunit protein uS11 n=1 Tax=Candidatus Yanofskybacteria bacterium RIFCSPHIGHO2_02_FULL_50_12 TaxID=1802685 RepID=A0A1F8FWR7_9BACT|nr:MAG: 30S ribosomal protein S11 [Candidatus Yanofskybacteria bacterium RIFCSPHIGHO2_02_FULL_50_12]
MTKDGETTAPEAAEVSVAPKKASAKKQVLNGTAVINVSYNNTLISIADSKGQVISWSSAGLLGFKGSKKSTPYAANLVAKDVFEKSKKFNLTNIKIVIKGIGPGRESAIRGLAGTGLNILSIMDATPIAHNGVRRPKPRRV